ncbi:hypothetical protein FAGAP_2822 [Fusarium agapanthi]|uniref:Secreted protein n=1 Tax=Fusarium agapanthi TaxID=1803897 RepID=A0A9P5BF71_9HYPO|nr:hypothetical protein FAGAP_2822 [Fusarium agapanthi]
MKISFAPLILVAVLAGFGEAGTCDARFLYCGQTLLELDAFKYFDRITAELTRATNRTFFKAHHISDTLFYCRPDSKGVVPEGKIRFFKHCKGYCRYETIGHNHTCQG